jgi:predicted transcriptional regulator
MNVKYRSRSDIVSDMLQVAQDGAIKTRIMHQSFLSFPQLNEYLELMTDRGLLSYSEEERKYHTTNKGRHFLKFYHHVGSAIAPKGRTAPVLEAS